jgi:hypothetical protein
MTTQANDWYTLDTLTFMDLVAYEIDDDDFNFTAKLTRIQGRTPSGRIVEVQYHATGDYQDRWIDARGVVHDISCWRRVR